MPKIKLPAIYASHMTLQRDKVLHVEGTAEGCASVRILLDGVSSRAAVVDGHFTCAVGPFPAGTGKTLQIFADDQTQPLLTLGDIQIGDIWLACGQSNMEYFLRYDADWNYTKKQEHNPLIRMYNVPQIAFAGQDRHPFGSGYWFEEGDPAWAVFSAPGYHFARVIQPDAGVPVAIVGCNWGGTPACAWTPLSSFSEEPLNIYLKEYEEAVSMYSPEELKRLSEEGLAFENSYRHELEWRTMMYGLTEEEQQLWMKEHEGDPAIPMGPWHPWRPGGLYETMVLPVSTLSVKGVLWYQGESDSGHGDLYDRTMTALIRSFRDTWKEPELPFLFVQLAPFGKWLDCGNEGYAQVRAAQDTVSGTVPGTAMASIMDLGSYEDIHPKFKMEVGRRLALLALKYVYGRDILADPPFCSAACAKAQEDGSLLIHMEIANTGEELYADDTPGEGFRIFTGQVRLTPAGSSCDGQELSGFECCIKDRGLQILLSSEDAAQAAAAGTLWISYDEENYCTAHIWNSAGLSMKPFRICVNLPAAETAE